MKNFWKIVMLTVLCVSLLCGVTAMAEADRFQFEKTNLTVFEGNTLELSLIRQGNCAADGELTFVSGRENIATVDENGVVTGLTKGQATITATLKTEKRTWKASVTVTVARAVTDIAVNETNLTLYDPVGRTRRRQRHAGRDHLRKAEHPFHQHRQHPARCCQGGHRDGSEGQELYGRRCSGTR